MSEMTIRGILEAKAELDKQVLESVQVFERNTQTHVRSVNLRALHGITDRVPHVVEVDAEVVI